jgi:hypothetical protein
MPKSRLRFGSLDLVNLVAMATTATVTTEIDAKNPINTLTTWKITIKLRGRRKVDGKEKILSQAWLEKADRRRSSYVLGIGKDR